MSASKQQHKVIRFTIGIPADLHATYQAMANMTGMSLSRTISEWLADTKEGAQMVTEQMAEAKAAPQRVLNNLLAATHSTRDLILQAKGEVRTRDREAATGARRGSSPPSSNTGVLNSKDRGGLNDQ
jgi:hypothetical protein